MKTVATFNTRSQYMNGEITHRGYYGQFVTNQTKQIILNRFTKEEIQTAFASNESMNTIPLIKWDAMVPHLQVSAMLKLAGDFLTLAGGVCILKEAARQIAEN